MDHPFESVGHSPVPGTNIYTRYPNKVLRRFPGRCFMTTAQSKNTLREKKYDATIHGHAFWRKLSPSFQFHKIYMYKQNVWVCAGNRSGAPDFIRMLINPNYIIKCPPCNSELAFQHNLLRLSQGRMFDKMKIKYK